MQTHIPTRRPFRTAATVIYAMVVNQGIETTREAVERHCRTVQKGAVEFDLSYTGWQQKLSVEMIDFRFPDMLPYLQLVIRFGLNRNLWYSMNPRRRQAFGWSLVDPSDRAEIAAKTFAWHVELTDRQGTDYGPFTAAEPVAIAALARLRI